MRAHLSMLVLAWCCGLAGKRLRILRARTSSGLHLISQLIERGFQSLFHFLLLDFGILPLDVLHSREVIPALTVLTWFEGLD